MLTYPQGQSRRDYLCDLADDYGVPLEAVFAIAGMLGPSEDFDGLITELDDISQRQEQRDAWRRD